MRFTSHAVHAGWILLALLARTAPAPAAQDGPAVVTDAELGSGELAIGALDPFMTVTLRGSFVARGAGLDGRSAATLVFDTIPDDARLVGAVVYWAFIDEAHKPAHGALRVNNTIVNGTLLGSVRACWTAARSSFVYRGVLSRDRLLNGAVHPLGGPLPPSPSGNGVYVISGFPIEDPTWAQGVTMILVYEQDAMRTRDLVFTDGNLMPTISPPPPFFNDTRVGITGFAAEAPVEASSTFVVGNGSPLARDQAFFENRFGVPRYTGHAFDSGDGPWWDTESMNLSGLVEHGDRTATVGVRIIATPSGGLFALDCLIWAAHVLSVTSSNPPHPDPTALFERQELLASSDAVGRTNERTLRDSCLEDHNGQR